MDMASSEKCAGWGGCRRRRHHGGDDADADQDLVDRPPANGDDGLGQGIELGADSGVGVVDPLAGRGGGHCCYLLR